MELNYKQLIRGNPGDVYIACILYVLHKKYRIITEPANQKELFVKGILRAKDTFFMSTLDEIEKVFHKPMNIYLSDPIAAKYAKQELQNINLKVISSKLSSDDIFQLLENKQYLVLSIDRFDLYPFYHDYYFVVVEKNQKQTTIFNPYIGISQNISLAGLDCMVYSARTGLKDTTIVITI